MTTQNSIGTAGKLYRDWFSVPALKTYKTITGKEPQGILAELQMGQYDETFNKIFNKVLYDKPLACKNPDNCFKKRSYKKLIELLKDERAKNSEVVKDFEGCINHGIVNMLRSAVGILHVPLVIILLNSPEAVTDQITLEAPDFKTMLNSVRSGAWDEKQIWDSQLRSKERPSWKCPHVAITEALNKYLATRAPREKEITEKKETNC